MLASQLDTLSLRVSCESHVSRYCIAFLVSSSLMSYVNGKKRDLWGLLRIRVREQDSEILRGLFNYGQIQAVYGHN